jgi:hypothetical protein
MKTLKDLIGKKVTTLLQTPWKVADGSNFCELYFKLQSGEIIYVSFIDDIEDSNLTFFEINAQKNDLIETEFYPEEYPNEMKNNYPTSGIITNIYLSESWPSIGIELNNEYIYRSNAWDSYEYGGTLEKKDQEKMKLYECKSVCEL